MGKFKMPKAQEFLKQKRIFGPIKDPVWVYIKREIKQNAQRRPHCNKVLNWLLFLKDLRYHYYREAKMKYNRLCRACGPDWYLEYSIDQKTILSDLKDHIHEDLLEDLPSRVRKDLWDLGITIRFTSEMLMDAMALSFGDPGLFIWFLYEKYFKKSPSDLQIRYDLNAMLMMSAIAFIDMEECITELNNLTTRGSEPPKPPVKKKSYYFEPNVKYGMYLQKTRVQVYSNHPANPPKPKKPLPIACKIRFKTKAEYEKLRTNRNFLEKRKQRNIKEKLKERVCKYKFWEPPALFGTDKKTADLVLKMKMLKLSAKPRYLKEKPPFENIQCFIAGVSFSANRPVYLISSFVTLPSTCHIVHGGLVVFGSEFVAHISGLQKHLEVTVDKGDKNCQCLKKWHRSVMEYLEDSKCACKHFYDIEAGYDCPVPTPREMYFLPPSRESPFLFDHARIYQLDAYAEHVDYEFKKAMRSESTYFSSDSELEISGLKNKDLLKMFLGDLAQTALMIPHLPQANKLNTLLEWVRKRVKGDISDTRNKQLMLKTQRGWLDLSHIDFRAKAYFIPFTLKQLQNMNWSHRIMIQKMSNILLRDFELRTRQEMIEHTRLFWATMFNHVYHSEAFVKAFFSYMPGRLYDTQVVNPYCSQNTPTFGAKTCHIEKPLMLSE